MCYLYTFVTYLSPMYKLVLYKYILKLYFVIHKKIDRGEGYVYHL